MSDRKYTLEELYRAGQLAPTVIKYRDINNKVSQLVKTGLSRGMAVKRVATDTGCCLRTVYNAQEHGLEAY